MKQVNSKRMIAGVSLLLFAVSLTQSAFTYKDVNGIHDFTSVMALLLGSIAILGGVILEWTVWLANPLYCISMVLFLKGNIKSKKTSVVASLLSLSFAFWSNIMASENGHESQIVSKNSGYVLWMLSIVVLTTGIHVTMKKAPRSD